MFCAGGYRSAIASSLLRAHGFSDVSDLLGGYTAWITHAVGNLADHTQQQGPAMSSSNVAPIIDVDKPRLSRTATRTSCCSTSARTRNGSPATRPRHVICRWANSRRGWTSCHAHARIVCICRSGNRSGQVTAWLQRQGYDAVNMTGGMQRWASHGHPVIDDAGQPGGVI